MLFCKRLAAFCLLLLLPSLSHAALTLLTRIIFDAAAGEASVSVNYPGRDGGPLLMQAWLDDGGIDIRPEAQKNIPFILAPAVARIEPGQTQTVRVIPTRHDLPAERESLFYFNVQEVPPTPTEQIAAGESFMQLAAHTRVKFFYRPRGLTPDPAAAPQLLRFGLAGAAGDKLQIRITNPSPYHMTLRDLRVYEGAAAVNPAAAAVLAEREPGELALVVAPMSELVVPLRLTDAVRADGVGANRAPLPAALHVVAGAINDYGGVTVLQQPLTR